MKLRLTNSEWELGHILSSGGFGTVYQATAPRGEEVAVKLIPKDPRAGRDLLFADVDAVQGNPGVVPVMDRGETDTHWAIVMALAAGTLRDLMSNGAIPFEDAKPVFIDILKALQALDGKVVHRDLKPENIFFLKGRWCLADFGIARYTEATTAPDTQKFSMTPPYAAPEQCRAE
jgi:serine/threonine protein kinase